MRTLTTIRTLTFAVAFLTFGSNAASANSIALGPRLGISKASESHAKFLLGAALRAKLASALGIEASIDYRQEDLANDELVVRTWPVQVTGLIYPLPVLYGAAGAGWYHTSFDFDDELSIDGGTETQFGWHFGGGLEVPVSDAVKVAADIRYVFLDYDFDDLPGGDDVDWDFYMVTAAVLFNLGDVDDDDDDDDESDHDENEDNDDEDEKDVDVEVDVDVEDDE